MSQSVLSVRMDSDTKAAFAAFCEEVGMSVSTAINLFARQTLREQRIPFEISTDPLRTRVAAQPAQRVLSRDEIAVAVAQAAMRVPGISDVVLFGSYARGEARPDSDIDLRIAYDEGALTLFDLSEFLQDVQEATGKSVDIVSRHDLGNDDFAHAIERDGVTIYERT
ncbi:type II toxin-antitoxin system RelB/DinJ family antitoxin [Collinsella sp. An271]|uniref:type II toxin-antitoxin system RelB/DinJ family antitoxin n=1 Tax=Collinsella sp. An271 TaxID=1965616 RepID=UPI00194F5F78|nr:type II toxin-antitoxin system RelB/DinJ family antitoxin [Collinsella sp. An271]